MLGIEGGEDCLAAAWRLCANRLGNMLILGCMFEELCVGGDNEYELE
jgi:hypothetical protein